MKRTCILLATLLITRLPAMRSAAAAPFIALAMLAWLPAGESTADAQLPAVSALPRSLDPDWLEAVRLEYADQHHAAGRAFERLLDKQPDRSDAAWRASRSFWQHGEAVTPEQREQWFERADALAAKGLLANPRCGECALWKYAAMGRLVGYRGSLWAMRHASDLRDLLDLGISLEPTHRDPNGNSALANLYYSSAIFYRMVPEWFWLPLIAGVKGDTARALVDIQKALAISKDRIDYQVEHGTVLLCRARREDDDKLIQAGVRVLEQAIALPPQEESDAIDQHYAGLLIEDPSDACGFTRRGFLDVEAMGREAGLGRSK